jgi:predicted amidohydrolase YtcJ
MKKLMLLSIVIWSVSGCIYQTEPADLVIHNANIYTNDVSSPKVQAVAIKDGKILELGAERDILNKYKATKAIDAKGMFVYPGWVDAHCHFLGLGQTLQLVNLQGVSSLSDFIKTIQLFHKNNPDSWVNGRGWDESLWDDKTIPSISLLDSLFPETPVFLQRVDGHSAVINTVVAKLANINAKTSIQGGLIEYKDGKFTGRLVDQAMTLIDVLLPKTNNNMNSKALISAERVCFENGLTTITDAGLNLEDILLIDSLQKAGVLKMPMNVMASDNDINKDYFFKNGGIETERLQMNSFKFYADGSLGSRSARLKKHYHDHATSGMMMNSKEYFLKQAKKMLEHDFQMNTHCIGDSAIGMMLSVYGEVLQTTNDKRWRIEHAQVLDDVDIGKFRTYSIIPSVQPTHALSDRRWAKDRLGDKRINGAYAYKDLLATNGVLAFGTDFPVETVSPLRTFFAAVFRKEPGELGEGWRTDQALSRKEALNAMTIGAAIANHQEHLYGSITVGKLANFTILNTDLLKDTEERLATTKVLRTIVMGEEVYKEF